MLGFMSFANTRPIPIANPILKQQTLMKTPYFKSKTKTPRGLKASSSQQLGGNGGEEVDELNKGKGFNLRWTELLLDPDPDNVLAVGLTGVLAWASVQVLWQLFVISFAILIAAVKYSFVAAILIFILITLL